MVITLGYTEDIGYEYDIRKAINAGKMTLFTLDVKLTPVQTVAESLTSKLLDNQKWQLKAKKRKKQTFITKPNLHLTNFRLETGAEKGKTYTLKELIEKWYYARALFINTGEVPQGIYTTSSTTKGLVKVIRGADELSYEQFESINYLESIQVTIETAGSY